MPLPIYTISCTKKLLIASGVYELLFTRPEGFSFIAGQYLLLQIPLVENPADIQPRAYSIASAPSEDGFLFVMKMTPGGRSSRWIEEVVQPGTTVQMQGPFGRFVINPDSTKDLLMIATGTGIAPFRSQLRTLRDQKDQRRVDLVFGVRAESDLFWMDELTSLVKENDHLFVHTALSDPSSTWTGHRGRVQSLVPLIVKDFSRKNIYACGSPDMTKDIRQLALTGWGIPKEDVHVEGYI